VAWEFRVYISLQKGPGLFPSSAPCTYPTPRFASHLCQLSVLYAIERSFSPASQHSCRSIFFIDKWNHAFEGFTLKPFWDGPERRKRFLPLPGHGSPIIEKLHPHLLLIASNRFEPKVLTVGTISFRCSKSQWWGLGWGLVGIVHLFPYPHQNQNVGLAASRRPDASPSKSCCTPKSGRFSQQWAQQRAAGFYGNQKKLQEEGGGYPRTTPPYPKWGGSSHPPSLVPKCWEDPTLNPKNFLWRFAPIVGKSTWYGLTWPQTA